jgi:hypothetical protein
MPDPYTGSGWMDPTQGGSSTGGGGMFDPTGMQLPTMGTGAPNNSKIPNPGGYSNAQGGREIQRNLGIENTMGAAYKNQLAPIFAKMMQQYGGNAGNFFQQLTNLGSPFYKQKQSEAFTQGVGQNQNAMADATQRMQSQGYGYTPSGTSAAMIGGMETAGAQSLAEQYLQNLFQNENLQMQGAQGQASLAGMFNPSQLLGGTSMGTDISIPSSFYQNFMDTTQGINNTAQAYAAIKGAGGGGGGMGCWIAAALYGGWDDPRTIDVRHWLNTEFVKQPIGRAVMKLYLRFGERIAEMVKRSAVVRAILRPLFDLALRKARA